ncbi:MAG: glucose 1-dehydrogenase [Bacillota bacterium]|nr:glucose 1-dehydrogenase [Bacillota bacterium]
MKVEGLDFSGKVAVITGGGKGLGKEFARFLGLHGARVVIGARNEEVLAKTARELQNEGIEVKAVAVDVTNSSQVGAMAEDVYRSMGPVEILINNAAIYFGVDRKSFMEINEDEWDQMLNVNVKGPWLTTKAFFPQMKELGRGKVVNIASEVFFTGSHNLVHYVASKGGVIGLTRALARELGQYNISVNAVAPGFTDTEASRTIVKDVSKYDTSLNCLQRLGVPQDVCGAVAFFASPYSDFITGQTMLVDGGRVMN